ncbi:unnamed protein product [Mytilus coruscus]|uniref:Uncharacterized protein n=1 Tax=Mytilus coruscus TaxID=42192 RepID=A0A6J8CQZ4_MYTCO|nr:unnamed protein product [Mytilus coruscus]
MDNMVDVTPSEVQMRVTSGICRQDESLNGDQPLVTARFRTQAEKDSKDPKITYEEQLLHDLEKHKETERDILEKLRGFKTIKENGFSHGRGIAQMRNTLGCDSLTLKGEGCSRIISGDETTREANMAPFRSGEDCRISVENRNGCVDTTTPVANTYMNRVIDSADKGYDSNRNLNRNNFEEIRTSTSGTCPEIKNITRLAYPTAPIDIRDQLAKDCFIRAVSDTKIQLTLFNREPKTIGDCVRVGVEYEAFVVDQKRLTNQKQAIRMQYETPLEQIDDDDNLLGQIAKMSHRLDDMAKFQKPNDYSGVTCFYCGVKGYMKKKLVAKHQNDRQSNTVKYRSTPNTQQRFTCGSQYTQGTQTDRQGN